MEAKIRSTLNINPIIIDIGIGNVGSLASAVNFLGLECSLNNDPQELGKASHLILPGVGAFDAGVQKIDHYGLRDVLREIVMEQKTPLMGICVGMQLLFEGSTEGKEQGLGFVPGKLEKLPSNREKNVKVPHAGFSQVLLEQSTGFFNDMGEAQSFYFTHSYAMRASGINFEAAICNHGFSFAAAFRYGNIYGTQFHPEKSQSAGLHCLANFFEGGVAI